MVAFFCSSICRRSEPLTDRVQIDPSAITTQRDEGNYGTAEADLAEFDAKWDESTSDRSDSDKGAGDAKWDEADSLDSHTLELEREPLPWERTEEDRSRAAADAERFRLEEELQQRLEERRLQEQLVQEEEQRQLEEAQRLQAQHEREEEERRREDARVAEEREQWKRKRQLRLFYKEHGFMGPNQPRKAGCMVWGSSTTYPLHCAAERADVRIVSLLLQDGALLSQRNSAGETAEQVARRKNKNSSHDGVLRLLGSENRKPQLGGA